MDETTGSDLGQKPHPVSLGEILIVIKIEYRQGPQLGEQTNEDQDEENAQPVQALYKFPIILKMGIDIL